MWNGLWLRRLTALAALAAGFVLVGGGNLLIVGSPQGPLTARLDGIRAGFADARVAANLREVGVDDPAPLLSLFAGGPAELRTYAAGAPVQNDVLHSLSLRTRILRFAATHVNGRSTRLRRRGWRVVHAEERVHGLVRR